MAISVVVDLWNMLILMLDCFQIMRSRKHTFICGVELCLCVFGLRMC